MVNKLPSFIRCVNIKSNSSYSIPSSNIDKSESGLVVVTCINTNYLYFGVLQNGWQAKGIKPIIAVGLSATYDGNNLTITNTSSGEMDFYIFFMNFK